VKCWRCGNIGHTSFKFCPSSGHTCNNCGKKGHFNYMCFSLVKRERTSRSTDRRPIRSRSKEPRQRARDLSRNRPKSPQSDSSEKSRNIKNRLGRRNDHNSDERHQDRSESAGGNRHRSVSAETVLNIENRRTSENRQERQINSPATSERLAGVWWREMNCLLISDYFQGKHKGDFRRSIASSKYRVLAVVSVSWFHLQFTLIMTTSF
jgi:hypothetical protein